MIHSISFSICGFLVFYDVGSPKARAQETQEVTINVNLNKRSVSTRLWEIRISQIPFSSKAPSGCLQHFTGIEGKCLSDPLNYSSHDSMYVRRFQASFKRSILLITDDTWRIKITSHVFDKRRGSAAFNMNRVMNIHSVSGRCQEMEC